MKKIFVIDLKYLKPTEEVDKFLVPHREYLDGAVASGNLLMSGRKEPLTGGMIISTFDSVWDAKEFMEKDPFIINRVAEYKITEFTPVKYNKGLAEVIGAPELKVVGE